MLGLWKCNQHTCACFHTALNGIPDSRKLISDKLQKTQTKWTEEVVIILKGGTSPLQRIKRYLQLFFKAVLEIFLFSSHLQLPGLLLTAVSILEH